MAKTNIKRPRMTEERFKKIKNILKSTDEAKGRYKKIAVLLDSHQSTVKMVDESSSFEGYEELRRERNKPKVDTTKPIPVPNLGRIPLGTPETQLDRIERKVDELLELWQPAKKKWFGGK